jgi:hypothetical protein
MGIGETAQLLFGVTLGLGVIFAALLASTASIRASESWAADNRVRATAFASFAGVSGLAALAGIVLGVIWVVVSSPIAS